MQPQQGRGAIASQPDSASACRAAVAARSAQGAAIPDGNSQPQLSGMNRCRHSSSTRPWSSSIAVMVSAGSRSRQ
jgi:hypothetical protein